MYIVTNSASPEKLSLRASTFEKLAIKGGQVHEPKLTTIGRPTLARLRREVEALLSRLINVGLGAADPH